MKILLAIPDPSVREGLVNYLQKRLSHDTLELVFNGMDLLDKARERCPEVIVMDTLLPGKDGVAVLRELRDIPALCATQIVLASSLTSGHILQAVAQLQPDYFTTLPCDIKLLGDQVLSCCRDQLRLSLEDGDSLELGIGRCLHKLGISARAKGYPYAKEAVFRIYHQPELEHALTKRLYPEIARKFGTNAACVERAIRSAIMAAWEKDGILLQRVLFEQRPTNGDLFCTLAEYFRAMAENVSSK